MINQKRIVLCAALLVSILSWVANYYALADHETLYILHIFFSAIFLSMVVVCLVNKTAKSWLKFLVWWVPLSLVLVFLDSPYNSLIFPSSMRLTRILAATTIIYSLLFFAIRKTSNTTKNSSILVIAYAIAFIGSAVLGVIAVNFLKS